MGSRKLTIYAALLVVAGAAAFAPTASAGVRVSGAIPLPHGVVTFNTGGPAYYGGGYYGGYYAPDYYPPVYSSSYYYGGYPSYYPSYVYARPYYRPYYRPHYRTYRSYGYGGHYRSYSRSGRHYRR